MRSVGGVALVSSFAYFSDYLIAEKRGKVGGEVEGGYYETESTPVEC